MRSLGFALAFLASLAAPARAARADADTTDTFREKILDVSRTAADPSAAPGAIWEKGQNLYLNRVDIAVQPNLRGWDFGRGQLGDGKEKTVDQLITGGERALSDLGLGVPPPDLRDAVAGVRESHRAGLMSFADDMNPRQMGRFLFTEGRAETGSTQINSRMAQMAGIIGLPFAFMTPLHEWVHEKWHREGRLSTQRVIEGELPAFMAQFRWLQWVDPHGERLAYAREWLANQKRGGAHGGLIDDAEAYLQHAADVRQTGGDERRMLELIERLGYRDGAGHHHPGDGHDHGHEEAHPTRA